MLSQPLLTKYGIDRDLCDAGATAWSPSLPGRRKPGRDRRPAGVSFPTRSSTWSWPTRLNQIEVLLFIVNDPAGERFATDLDWQGRRTKFGTFRRNIPEEVRAMQAGLTPGQVRQGLRVSRSLVPLLESFVLRLSHDYYLMEPMAYHNAILFERQGFNYVQGLRKMQWINEAFQPGGQLHAALDGSTPFRQSDAWQTVRGRSWAIHDGILGEPWHGVRMYKQVGKHAGVDTFPGGTY